MKKIIFICLLLILVYYHSFSQSGWVWQNPLPQGNGLNSSEFIDNFTGFCVGNSGTIMKTTNGGNNWIIKHNVLGIETSFYSTKFVNAYTGWVVGYGGLIIKTTDNGNNWFFQQSGTTLQLYSVHFINPNTGWAVGKSGVVLKTINGGDSWNLISTIQTNYLYSVFFINEQLGFSAGTYNFQFPYGAIFRTTDGGVSWEQSNYNTGDDFRSIKFINMNTGWAVGKTYGTSYVINKTTDSGLNWSQMVGFTGLLHSVFPVSENTIFTVGDYSQIFKSIDGGLNWTQIPNPANYLYDFLNINFTNSSTGWIFGEYGIIFQTTNGGSNWISHSAAHSILLNSILFLDANTGWAVGGCPGVYAANNLTCLFKTINGGINWNNIAQPNMGELKSIQFLDNNTGRVLGNSINGYPYPTITNIIYRTTNGGYNWQSSNISNYSGWEGLNSIYFLNESTGWAAGYNGEIRKSTNSGVEWVQQQSGTNHTFYSVYFIDGSSGYVCGGKTNPTEAGSIWKSIDGGVSWAQKFSSNTPINNLFFLNAETGWGVGGNGTVLKTTNSGDNWLILTSGLICIASLNSIKFVNNFTGYVVGNTGNFFRSTNGGVNWERYLTTTENNLVSLCIIENNNLWTCGEGATILKSSNGGIPLLASPGENKSPSSFSLSQNYPNPFNPVTRIKFSIPPSKVARGMITQLVIYDALGREIAVLVNEQLSPGIYEDDWDASNYPSGVYFYRLTAGDYAETKKMILLK